LSDFFFETPQKLPARRAHPFQNMVVFHSPTFDALLTRWAPAVTAEERALVKKALIERIVPVMYAPAGDGRRGVFGGLADGTYGGFFVSFAVDKMLHDDDGAIGFGYLTPESARMLRAESGATGGDYTHLQFVFIQMTRGGAEVGRVLVSVAAAGDGGAAAGTAGAGTAGAGTAGAGTAGATRCYTCAVPDGAWVCGGCERVVYCSPSCQAADWARHAAECRVLKRPGMEGAVSWAHTALKYLRPVTIVKKQSV
jgi:hypothetical protein